MQENETPPTCLAGGAVAALKEPRLGNKILLTQRMAKLWYARRLSLISSKRIKLPSRPGRPKKPELLPPDQVPKRTLSSQKGRIALLHAIAHIELNAIDLALDIIARFADTKMPRSFFDDWVMVANEEAKHFTLLQNRLAEFGATYGDLPAHDGLWEAAQQTSIDLTARLAIVPLVLEARGLDVTPSLILKLEQVGDIPSADIFRIIYEDEKGHVAVGAKWFRFLCYREGVVPAATFQRLVRANFRGQIRPPFNERARSASGITPGFYRSLSPLGN